MPKLKSLYYIDRETGAITEEFFPGALWIKRLYASGKWATIGRFLITHFKFVSRIYGFWQKLSWTRTKIIPFIKKYQIDDAEFARAPSTFRCFNDFFIRQLKKEARPLAKGAIIPADGRYRFFTQIPRSIVFPIKGQTLSLDQLLGSSQLASQYEGGTMVLGRLAPVDYHRFHFPIDTIPSKTKFIKGHLASVNPLALHHKLAILSENKRVITHLDSEEYGKVLMIEIGATNVGSIIQTYPTEKAVSKGDEKGYFSFGGSALILLFEKDRLQLSSDLRTYQAQELEIRCLMGQPLGLPS